MPFILLLGCPIEGRLRQSPQKVLAKGTKSKYGLYAGHSVFETLGAEIYPKLDEFIHKDRFLYQLTGLFSGLKTNTRLYRQERRLPIACKSQVKGSKLIKKPTFRKAKLRI